MKNTIQNEWHTSPGVRPTEAFVQEIQSPTLELCFKNINFSDIKIKAAKSNVIMVIVINQQLL